MMRHSAQAQSSTVVRLAAAFLFALAGLSGSPKISSSQTTIKTVQDLQNISNNLSGSYVLGSDIDASGFKFTPIGCYGVCPNGSAFTGTFNGNGHVVTNLAISTTLSQAGLFYGVSSSGKVENLGLTNASISANGQIGGIAGSNAGSITNSYVTGTVSGISGSAGGLVGLNDFSSKISQSYATVSVTGTGTGGIQLGGVAGTNHGSISQSYATGKVTSSTPGSGSAVGGLVGLNTGPIQQSYSLAGVTGAGFNTVGGLVGNNQNTISQSYAAGKVQGSGTSVGGLVGFALLPQSIAVNSYWDPQTTGQPTSAGAPGLAGFPAQLQSGTLPGGFDPVVWVAILGQYPLLRWQVPIRPVHPVVFVHGICSDSNTWKTVTDMLTNLGWVDGGSVGRTKLNPNGDFYTVNFSDPAIGQGLEEWAVELRDMLNTIKSVRGTPTKFIIVAHSAGGLAARVYLQGAQYQSDIYHLITYGTPHRGILYSEKNLAIQFIPTFLPICSSTAL